MRIIEKVRSFFGLDYVNVQKYIRKQYKKAGLTQEEADIEYRRVYKKLWQQAFQKHDRNQTNS